MLGSNSDAIAAAIAYLEGSTPEQTATYNNGKIDVPAKPSEVITVTKDNVQAEVAWLEIAPLGEYTAVASSTELCLKCHAPVDLPQHGSIDLVSAHAGYQCTDCHSFHETTATCVSEACHSDVIEPESPIPGHDADHQAVSCVACHDGGGMGVGPDDASGQWTTFITKTSADGTEDRFAFTSHNVVLAASCDRCHFVDNPWALSTDIVVP